MEFTRSHLLWYEEIFFLRCNLIKREDRIVVARVDKKE